MVQFFLRCSNAHMPLHLFCSIILLLTSMEVAHSDATRLPLRLLEISTSKEQDEIRGEMKMEGRGLIGSRPPRCERVCMSCGHCEAVQVPIVPQDQKTTTTKITDQENVESAISAAIFAYRANGISNYKPLSWKCKCGGIILDP